MLKNCPKRPIGGVHRSATWRQIIRRNQIGPRSARDHRNSTSAATGRNSGTAGGSFRRADGRANQEAAGS